MRELDKDACNDGLEYTETDADEEEIKGKQDWKSTGLYSKSGFYVGG